jgi:hypothetical protein
MFFPYFRFNEGCNDEFAEPQVSHILRAMDQENNLWPARANRVIR